MTTVLYMFSQSDLAARAKEQAGSRPDYLKVISGTGGLWPSLDSETVQALVTAAHARGLVVVARVSSVAP